MKQLGADEIAEHKNWCLVVEIENNDLIGYPELGDHIYRMLERFANTFTEPIDQAQLHLCLAENCNGQCIN